MTYKTPEPAGLLMVVGIATTPTGNDVALTDIPAFTADQLTAAVLEALGKMGDQMYDAMFDIKGDKVTRFDAQTAIRNIKESAIRQLAEQVKKGVGNG